MQAEIIAVGTEILLGQIVNTNTTFISQQLAQLGINTYYQTVVGDNEERLLSAIEIAAQRNDLVILSGGLGPTPDDLTKQTVAKYLGLDLVEDATAMDKIEAYFQTTGKKMTANNRLQALYLAGGQALANETGMAVGCYYENTQGADFLLLPGPPSELKPMVAKVAKPLLAHKVKGAQVLTSRVLRFFGIGESLLAEKLADLLNNSQNPTAATYAKDNEVTLRLTASGQSNQEVTKLLDQAEIDIQTQVGQYFYGYGDDNSLAQVVVQKLKAAGLKITAAESLTGGQFQAALTSVPGSSVVFDGGFVTYAQATKASLLDIPSQVLDQHGVVSQECAQWMAQQAKKKVGADIGLSFTGVAGPDSLEEQPAGTVWIGLAFKDQAPVAKKYHFPKQRAFVQERCVYTGLWLVLQALLAAENS